MDEELYTTFAWGILTAHTTEDTINNYILIILQSKYNIEHISQPFRMSTWGSNYTTRLLVKVNMLYYLIVVSEVIYLLPGAYKDYI